MVGGVRSLQRRGFPCVAYLRGTAHDEQNYSILFKKLSITAHFLESGLEFFILKSFHLGRRFFFIEFVNLSKNLSFFEIRGNYFLQWVIFKKDLDHFATSFCKFRCILIQFLHVNSTHKSSIFQKISMVFQKLNWLLHPPTNISFFLTLFILLQGSFTKYIDKKK